MRIPVRLANSEMRVGSDSATEDDWISFHGLVNMSEQQLAWILREG